MLTQKQTHNRRPRRRENVEVKVIFEDEALWIRDSAFISPLEVFRAYRTCRSCALTERTRAKPKTHKEIEEAWRRTRTPVTSLNINTNALKAVKLLRANDGCFCPTRSHLETSHIPPQGTGYGPPNDWHRVRMQAKEQIIEASESWRMRKYLSYTGCDQYHWFSIALLSLPSDLDIDTSVARK